MTQLHALPAPGVMVGLTGLALAAALLAAAGRAPRVLEWARLGMLVVLVAQAALGLALALRGAAPAEGIHWLYGVVIIVVLLLPGALGPEVGPRARSGALALGAGIAATLAWRLWASG